MTVFGYCYLILKSCDKDWANAVGASDKDSYFE